MIAEITPTETEAKDQALAFPASSIKKAFRWIKAGEVTEVKAALKVFGVIEAVLSGEEGTELENEDVFVALPNGGGPTIRATRKKGAVLSSKNAGSKKQGNVV